MVDFFGEFVCCVYVWVYINLLLKIFLKVCFIELVRYLYLFEGILV